MAATITTKSTKAEPLVKINFISHGTLESKDMQASRRFYEEVLGFEVIQHADIAMTLRLGSDHTYIVVASGEAAKGMNMMNHNGLDVGSRDEVDRAYQTLSSVQQEYGLLKVQKPHTQHGAYSFYFQDMDANWWEILANEPRGYSRWFDDPKMDLSRA